MAYFAAARTQHPTRAEIRFNFLIMAAFVPPTSLYVFPRKQWNSRTRGPSSVWGNKSSDRRPSARNSTPRIQETSNPLRSRRLLHPTPQSPDKWKPSVRGPASSLDPLPMMGWKWSLRPNFRALVKKHPVHRLASQLFKQWRQ